MALEVDIDRQLGDLRIQASFSSAAGITALFGRSGAGKSSIINMISGLLKPDCGRIVVDGRILFDHQLGINLPPHKRRIGYVFQESRLFPHLKVRRNLLYGMRFIPPHMRYIGFKQIVDLLGIGHLLERQPSMLSGGERQRVAIGRALLSNPQLLLMDEPLASLDAARKNEILPYIERLRDELKIPMVYVSHVFEEVTRLADVLVVMADGRMAAAGPLTEVTSRIDLSPLTGIEHTGVVIEAQIVGQDTRFNLTHLRSTGGNLVVPRVDLPDGTVIRVHIRSSDVAIALEAPSGLSIQNILPARIVEISEENGTSARLKLDVAGIDVTAQITLKSVHDLKLARGCQVYALIKSVALDHHDFIGI